MPRIDGRKTMSSELWRSSPISTSLPRGSCLIRCGNTHVLCTASVEDRPPRHVPEGEGVGHRRVLHAPPGQPGAVPPGHLKLKLNGRSAEIQRLIGRALRSVVDMKKLGPWNITIDCDVLQGDGGTRTASITGGFVAMMLAFRKMMEAGQLAEYPVSGYVAAVSAGIVDDVPLLDLCYEGGLRRHGGPELRHGRPGPPHRDPGHRRERPFTLDEQRQLVELCEKGIRRLQTVQRAVLEG